MEDIIKVDSTHFGDTLKRIRNQRGWSQDELAAKLNTSKQVISRYERGERTPKISVAARYAVVLGVSLSELAGIQPQFTHDDILNLFNNPSSQYSLTKEEENLIYLFRSLNPEGQRILLKNARAYAQDPDLQQLPPAASVS